MSTLPIRATSTESGLAIIVTNDYSTCPGLATLHGTVKDGDRMESAFQSLNFVPFRKKNISKPDFVKFLYDIVRCSAYPPSLKCIAFVFSGHGLDKNQIYMQDGAPVSVDGIIQQFLPERAPQIGIIPKLFFIDACRGNQDMHPVVVPDLGSKGVAKTLQKGGIDSTLVVPPSGNFLIAYSTMPYYKSYEQKEEGGVWMTILSEKLCTSSESILDILTSVNEVLMQQYQLPEWTPQMQQPEIISRLNQRLYLLPGPAKPPMSGANNGYGSGTNTQVTPTQKSSQRSGHYRGELNTMYQNGVISKPIFRDNPHYDEHSRVLIGFTSTVKFTVCNTKKDREFSSQRVHKSKPLAQENAAKFAVNALEPHIWKGSGSSSGATPQTLPPQAPQQSPSKPMAPLQKTVPCPKTPVQQLKEYCEQQKLSPPEYTEVLGFPQSFQFKIKINKNPTPLETIGEIRGSKQEAKQSAAQTAIQIWNPQN